LTGSKENYARDQTEQRTRGLGRESDDRGGFAVFSAAILLLSGMLGFSGASLALTVPLGNTVFTFTGGSTGANPYAGLIAGAGGVLYGTTMDGGSNGLGAIFSATPPTPKAAHGPKRSSTRLLEARAMVTCRLAG
jgi:uncharacterized repeat protein (TIGR03803 family)